MEQGKRLREAVEGFPGVDYFEEKARRGWRLTALEWEKEGAEADDADESGYREEVPYGLRVDDDCRHLVEDPQECRILTEMLEQLIADKPLSEAAAVLNRRGYRTRQGSEWRPLDIFNLFPRLIEMAPRIYPTEDWSVIRRNLRLVG